jgi:hypothetical protein
MTFTDFLPPKTWAFIVKLADENNLSTKEVQRILLNDMLFKLGMTCKHQRIGYSKTGHKPYCKDCWTRFRQDRERQYNYETKKWAAVNKFLPLDTFLDNPSMDNEEEQRQVKAEDRQEFV